MFQSRNIVSAIELGTSKICVLVGESREDGGLDVIGRGEAESRGVIKGEIANMEELSVRLAAALEEADSSSGGELNNSGKIVLPVTGCGICSYQGVGTAFVKNPDRRVTEQERLEANRNARVYPMETGRMIFTSAESFFVIDDRLQLRNPINQTACKLDAHVHVVHGITNRLENFRTAVRECGCREDVEIVFSPMASGFGSLSEEEHEGGVLLIDVGAGVTEYVVEFNTGILTSGMLQVGFNHLINDLSVGLDLPFDVCRRLVEDGTLDRLARERRSHMDFPCAAGKVRRIPMASFETIIEYRLRELFEIIRTRTAEQTARTGVGGGVVLTGGGALFEPVRRICRETFDMSVRVGQPLRTGEHIPGLESPRYSTVWGALEIADVYYRRAGQMFGSPLRRVAGGMDGVMGRIRRFCDDFRGAFRI